MSKGTQMLAERFAVRGAQTELAKATGVAQSWLSRLATHSDLSPDLRLAQLLEVHAGIPTEAWLEASDPVTHTPPVSATPPNTAA